VFTDWIDECERVNDEAQNPEEVQERGREGATGQRRTMADDLAQQEQQDSSDLEEY